MQKVIHYSYMRCSHVPISMLNCKTKSIIVVDFKSTIKLMRMQNDHILVVFELLCTFVWPFRSFNAVKILSDLNIKRK